MADDDGNGGGTSRFLSWREFYRWLNDTYQPRHDTIRQQIPDLTSRMTAVEHEIDEVRVKLDRFTAKVDNPVPGTNPDLEKRLSAIEPHLPAMHAVTAIIALVRFLLIGVPVTSGIVGLLLQLDVL